MPEYLHNIFLLKGMNERNGHFLQWLNTFPDFHESELQSCSKNDNSNGIE